MMTSRALGNIFKKTREKLGITIEDAHLSSRMHPDVIRDIENGVFDRLGPIYIKSFIKKYAKLLKMDQPDVLRKYEAVVRSEGEADKQYVLERPVIEKLVEEQTLFRKPSKESAHSSVRVMHEDRSRATMIVVVVIGTILFVFMFVGSIRLNMSGGKTKPSERVAVPIDMVESKTLPSSRRKEKTTESRGTVPMPKLDDELLPEVKSESVKVVPEAKPASVFPFGFGSANENVDGGQLTLILKASGVVWVQVFDNDRTVFVGTLEAGEAKMLKSEKNLTVWTGKGENLAFVINGHDLGRAADGVVRDIDVSRHGIKIDGKWIKRVD